MNQLQLSESQTNQSVQILKYSHQSPPPNLPFSNMIEQEDAHKSQQMQICDLKPMQQNTEQSVNKSSLR